METTNTIKRYVVECGHLEPINDTWGGYDWQIDGMCESDIHTFDSYFDAEEFFVQCADDLRREWKREGISRPGAGYSGMANTGLFVQLEKQTFAPEEVEQWGEDAEPESYEVLDFWQYTSDDHEAEEDIIDLQEVVEKSRGLTEGSGVVLWLFVEESEDGEKVAGCTEGTENSGFAYFDYEGNRHSAQMSIDRPMTASQIVKVLESM